MIKSDFWKILDFVAEECNPATYRWFEGMSVLYALNADACDEFIAAFSYFDEDKEV